MPSSIGLQKPLAQKHSDREWERLLDRERVAHDELADIDRRKDEFLAMLGHELRNPLSGIVMAVELLEQRGCLDPVAVEMHGVIRRQSQHMKKLIEDLLDVSRIACGKILLQMVRLDLVALTRDVVDDHKQFIDANQLTLVFEHPDTPIWMVGDATRLAQVITNLLHNATKFTDPGGTICVCLNRSGESAVLKVQDTGIGIEPTELATVFEPFRQAESSRVRSQGGLGLGLALCKQLVEKHKGVITAASEGPGCGSVFRVQLPLDREVPNAPQPATKSIATLTAHRILIVDDRSDARSTLEMVLSGMGQQVAQAESGAAAIATAKCFHPEIVLCDIGLPDIDGYDVARAMRADPLLNGVSLVALTGYGQAEDRDRAFKAGFVGHLPKPFSCSQLKEMLLEIHTQRQSSSPKATCEAPVLAGLVVQLSTLLECRNS